MQANKLAARAAVPRHDDSALAPSYERDYRMSPSNRLAAMKNNVVNACGRYEIEFTAWAPW
jgi:hypothetical protein